jgi:hypothetical protein
MTDQLRKKFENLQLNAGQGKISAFLSVSLGFLGIFAAFKSEEAVLKLKYLESHLLESY